MRNRFNNCTSKIIEAILLISLDRLRKQLAKKQWPPSPEKLHQEYFVQRTNYRDGLISLIADDYLFRFEPKTLSRNCNAVLDLLDKHIALYWEYPTEDNAAHTSAYALAILGWLRAERLETAPPDSLSLDVLNAFLAKEIPAQLTLF